MGRKILLPLLVLSVGFYIVLTHILFPGEPRTQEITLATGEKINAVIFDSHFPRLIVMDLNDVSLNKLELMAKRSSVGQLSPGKSMVFQFYDKPDILNHGNGILKTDLGHWMYEIEVFYEPSLDTPPSDMSNYRTVIRTPSNQ